MISAKLAKKLLEKCLETGADFAELFIEKSRSESIVYDNDKIESFSTNFVFGVGIRIIKGLQSVYGHSNDVKEKSLSNLIEKLIHRFDGKKICSCEPFKSIKNNNNSPIDIPYFEVPSIDKINMLKICNKEIRAYSNSIVRAVSFFTCNKREIEIYNSKGLHTTDSAERIRFIIEAFATQNGKNELAYNIFARNGGFNFFKGIDLITESKTVAQDAINLLSAKDCPSGKMPVVIGSGFGGTLFHEACGHSLEATSVSKNLSVFANKLGTQIASPVVTAYDNGIITNKFGTNNIDDEGQKTQKTCLIEKGILKNYLIDQFNGRRMNMNSNGCSRRENYRYEPTSRMSNTYIDNGDSTLEEIIKNTKLGLYAKKLNGGSVSPIDGEFEFGCSEAYIIRDGKICEQVKGATLIGKGEEVLKNIDMVGNDLDFDSGYCGSQSGSIPVTTGQPTIRVKEMLVGGNGEKLK